VNRLVKQANGDIPGLSDNDDSDEEDEYIDEDKYTTVTIESVGISREGFSRPGEDLDPEADKARKAAEAKAAEEAKESGNGRPEIKRDANGKRIWTKERPRTEWPKKKKKKFRYETKADRKVTRQKEGAKKRKLVSKQKEARATKEER
jgi:ribosomal RNA-processing protein 17